MATSSWITGIQGLTTLLTGNGQTTQRRGTLKVSGGLSAFDDGSQTVLGGVQVITGSGTWDTKSGTVLVKGTGSRTISVPNPDTTLQYEGFQLLVTTFTSGPLDVFSISTANVNTAGFGPTGQYGFVRLLWLSSNQWRNIS